MTDIKVGVYEIDGEELGIASEYRLTVFDVLPTSTIPLNTIWNIESGESLILVSPLTINGKINISGKLGVF